MGASWCAELRCTRQHGGPSPVPGVSGEGILPDAAADARAVRTSFRASSPLYPPSRRSLLSLSIRPPCPLPPSPPLFSFPISASPTSPSAAPPSPPSSPLSSPLPPLLPPPPPPPPPLSPPPSPSPPPPSPPPPPSLPPSLSPLPLSSPSPPPLPLPPPSLPSPPLSPLPSPPPLLPPLSLFSSPPPPPSPFPPSPLPSPSSSLPGRPAGLCGASPPRGGTDPPRTAIPPPPPLPSPPPPPLSSSFPPPSSPSSLSLPPPPPPPPLLPGRRRPVLAVADSGDSPGGMMGGMADPRRTARPALGPGRRRAPGDGVLHRGSPTPTTSTSRSRSAPAGTAARRLRTAFNETHILATTQAICDYRKRAGVRRPAVHRPRHPRAVRAGVGDRARGAGRQRRDRAGRRPRRLHADPGGLARDHRAPTAAARPGRAWPTASWSRRRTTRRATAASSTTRRTAARPTPTPPR